MKRRNETHVNTHLLGAGSSMRLASCDSWLLLRVSEMLGSSCSSLREGGGGVRGVCLVLLLEGGVAEICGEEGKASDMSSP